MPTVDQQAGLGAAYIAHDAIRSFLVPGNRALGSGPPQNGGHFQDWLFKRPNFYAEIAVLPRHRSLADYIYVLKDPGGVWNGIRFATTRQDVSFVFEHGRDPGGMVPPMFVLGPRFGCRRRRQPFDGWIFAFRSNVASVPRLEGHESAYASCAARLAQLVERDAQSGDVVQPIDDLFDDLMKDSQNRKLARFSAIRTVQALFERSPKDTDVGSVASAVGQSARTIQRKVKAMTGLSPKQFLEVRRFESTVRAIMKRGVKLSEVAGRLGYADQSHLTRDFRKHAGVSPTAFQRLWQEGSDVVRYDVPGTRMKVAFWG